jgi:peptidoglycan hydrolase-like protein with peptidoglycan-binding domain
VKKAIFIAISILAPVLAAAATSDFSASEDVGVEDISFGAGETTLIIFSGSTAESVSVSASELSVTNPGSAFKVGSADAGVVSLRAELDGASAACADNAAPGVSYVTLPSASGTYVLVPSSSSCPAAPAASTPSAARVSRAEPVRSFLTTPAGVVPVAPFLSTLLSTPLSPGVTSPAVAQLQTLLAKDKSVYPEGTVSGYFGPQTKRAIERFQEKYGIAAKGQTGYGVFGPATRAKFNEVFGQPALPAAPAAPVAPAAPQAPAVPAKALFSGPLSLGMRSNEVALLQTLLKTDPSVYPEGIVSGYFGPQTKRAVERFQLKYGFAKEGDPGFGSVGPKSRAKLQELFGGR